MPESATNPIYAANRASIDLAYPGDRFGCWLQLIVQIDDQTAQPNSNRFMMRNVLVGPQEYAITGSISCAVAGVCAATGSGIIDVVNNQSYLVSWLNTAVGRCQVTLQQWP
ncbi:MAG: hypothetical protein JO309_06450 [Pseudonocardiales bacterium]|nr:hypothetical protein [Pseudonocardiales bacterium]MBV9729038.1 hypothetical protein [Pseudonocardiales bacterium]